jgi:hypothetical protein
METKKQFFRSQRKLIERILVNGIRAGEFRRCDTKEMANIIMGSLRGVIFSMAVETDVSVTPRGLSEFVFKGLLKTGERGE